jgi:hypothetical protein
VCSNDRSVDDAAVGVDFELQRFEKLFPRSPMGSFVEPIVDGFPWSVPLWQVAPRTTSLGAIDYRVYKRPISPKRIRTPAFR